jgi:hypothetical protein
MNAMKTVLLVFSLLCATAAFGQAAGGGGALSNEPQMVEFHSHEQHASQHDMARVQSVMEQSGYFHARGERPLWEVAPVSHEMPLGDVARIQRAVHATAKKAQVVWTD